jgi:hypothetical protein
MDVDVVAAFDHLLGGLREARLVAIDRRNREEARQETEQRDDQQHRDRAQVRAHGEIDDPRELVRENRLAALVAGRDHHVPCPI